MILQTERKKATEHSHPFATAAGKKNFAARGYVEEEYFFHGAAHVYGNAGDGSVSVLHSDIPYCNRYLLRRPGDMIRFSGRIVLEILNATAKMDLDRIWVLCGEEIMDCGDIYVGITSKPDVLDALWHFDPERYREISWRVPYDNSVYPNDVDSLLLPIHEDCETGLIWDMITDLAAHFREEYGQKCRLILSGWSQSVGYMRTYLQHFAFQNNSHSLFDGYFAAGGVGGSAAPLCQQEYARETSSGSEHISYMPVPFIAVQTESENARYGGQFTDQPDSDLPNLLYRRYEIAGATHDTKYNLLDYYTNDQDTEKIGMTPQYIGTDPLPNDYPSQFVFAALYRLLCRWITQGALPPTVPRIAVKEGTEENQTDAFGNAMGGVRTPFVDAPACTYYNYSRADMSGGYFYLFGHQTFFTRQQMQNLYGSTETYLQRVTKSCNQQIKEGFLRGEDREAVIQKALENAKQTGFMN